MLITVKPNPNTGEGKNWEAQFIYGYYQTF